MSILQTGILDVLDFLGLSDSWGVFSGGSKAIDFDSFVAVDYRNSARLSNFPQEEGAFATYNKVQNPYDIKITLTKGGSDSDRAQFLTTLESLQKDIKLYNIQTPEISYVGANLERFDYRRSERSGRTMITADLYFKEIRVSPGVGNWNPTQPGGSAAISLGQISAKLDSMVNSLASQVTGAIGGLIPSVPSIPSIPDMPGLDTGILGGIV